jgi:peptide/nickel transport system permease protein
LARYLGWRLVQNLLVLLVVSLLAFVLVRASGDPLSMYSASGALTQADRQRLIEAYGLDRPLPVQYLYWLRDFVRGDWGYSFATRQSVTGMLAQRVPDTLVLMGSSFLVTLLVAVPLGVWAATHRDSALDRAISALSSLAFATPTFWLGILAILVFAVKFKEWGLPALPAGGMYDLVEGRTLLGTIRHLALPVAILSLVSLASYTQYLRSAMIEALSQDYVRTALAKGTTHGRAVWGHAFKNASLPLATLIILDLPRIFSGALITEQVFAWPGMGRLFVDHAQRADYPVLMAITMSVAILVVLFSTLGELVYARLDPRIRFR